MKARIFILFLLATISISCTNDGDNPETKIDGNYSGIFERNGTTSNVELTFTNGTFTGQTEVEKFPAICKGTYSISGNKITFYNTCPWTAEFDWTLILSGEWDFNLNNKTLILKGPNGDKYTLTQQ
ncbi:hypothetical protein FK178_03370 [Antarcticibacterium arcticum]|uniref:META domain-containing protein n=1 Tax=Antarcticibacterium arcticum TaxID=2585771 RepID=A0A5B8YIE7_9FLAO|nr:hypothetical protein [Antarcticibacterium arcticum]QED36808.1 hypothetical protein FK178_03370 [Antarcticibacterium arcticum]